MNVILMFSPTRHRDYTGTPYDMVDDLLVPFGRLEAVCCTTADTFPVERYIKETLRKDCPLFDNLQYQTDEYEPWRNFVEMLWRNSIHTSLQELGGLHVGQPLPEWVVVVLKKERRRIWGGKMVDRLRPVLVTTSRRDALTYADTDRHVIIEKQLLGIPVATTQQ